MRGRVTSHCMNHAHAQTGGYFDRHFPPLEAIESGTQGERAKLERGIFLPDVAKVGCWTAANLAFLNWVAFVRYKAHIRGKCLQSLPRTDSHKLQHITV